MAVRNRASWPSRKTRAFTVVELLLAAAIMAMLLASVAIAMHASLMSYRENEKIAETLQVARVVLSRITSELRTAEAVDCGSQWISIIPPVNPENVTEIEYELDGGTLYYRRTVSGQEVTQAFISSDEDVQIEQFAVSSETDVDGEGITYTKSLTVKMTLRSGDNRFSLTASACPRRNRTY